MKSILRIWKWITKGWANPVTLHAPQILGIIVRHNSPDPVVDEGSRNPARMVRRLFLSRLRREESGQDLIEYALAAALMGLSAVSGMNGLAANVANAFDGVSNVLTNAIPSDTAPPDGSPSTPPSPPPDGHHHHDRD